MKAIIVDDEPDGIRTLKKLLELNCPEVEITATCTTAASAKQKLEETKPDVVFLDVRMPGKSGLDRAERARTGRSRLPFAAGAARDEHGGPP